MKIVKLSELNDEERRKLIEEEENRINQRNKERINIQQQANTDFNNQIAKSGSYQSKGSTSLGTLRKLYKDNSVTEKSLNNYYNTHKNNNQKTMWDRVKQRALQTDIKGVAQNFGLGAKGALTKTIYSLNKYSGTEKTLNNIYNRPDTKQIKLEKTLDLINKDKEENNITNKNILLPQKTQDVKFPILDNYEVKNEKTLKELEYLNKYNNPLEVDIRKDNDKIQENINKQEGLLGKALATVAPSIR